MGLDGIFNEISYMWRQIGRQQKEIQTLRRAGISTTSVETLLVWMQAKDEGLCDQRDRLLAEEGAERLRQAHQGYPGTPQGLMDNLRRFPAPWTMEERKDDFEVKDASGFFICGVPHREDLHRNGYQYAHQFLSREEARRIAKAISRLPELLKRQQY